MRLGPKTAARAAAAALLIARAAGAQPASALAPRDYDAPDPDRDALNYARAAANVLFGNYLIFQIDWFRSVDWIFVTRGSIGKSLSSGYQLDYDPLTTNMLGHPIHGSFDFNGARSAGLSFWESALFPLMGSLEWDFVGERQEAYPGGWRSKPSTNDVITTSTSGILLGETLYRLSSAILDDSKTGMPRALREIGATIVDPMRGLNRLYTGAAWEMGAPPTREHPVRAGLEVGIDRLRTANVEHPKTYDPTALVAIQFEYGDLLPTRKDETLAPFEFFEGYIAMNLFDGQLAGSQVYGQGLIYGWSYDITSDTGELRDNNVIGLVQSFDFQGANAAQFAALGVGPADYVQWRWGPRHRLRLGVDIDWTYLAATASPFASPERAGHNWCMGVSAEVSGRLQLGGAGELSLRASNYITSVVDGQGSEEVIGYGRLAYDVPLVEHIALGLSPTLHYRRSSFETRTAKATALETQIYLHLN